MRRYAACSARRLVWWVVIWATSRPRVQTKPVVDYYSKQGLYSPIDADQKADVVKAAIAAILSK